MWRSRGIHWKNASNPKLANLAMWRAYEMEPDMMDAEEEHDGTIEGYFGSSSARITLRSIDAEVSGIFLHGYCFMMAWAIHVKTGLPMIAFTSSESTAENWCGHVAVKVGDDEYLDISGVQSYDLIKSVYGKVSGPMEIDPQNLQGFVSEEYRTDPMRYFDELERLITEDFADMLIAEHHLPVLDAT
ncbi:MAG: hypothetical protein H9W81_12540 [Enterococcus sp.]|nr:hypothetical protein [Enterococcus sp.]